MHIVLTNFLYKPHFGGVENSLYHISKVLIENGHQVSILVSDKGTLLNERLKDYEVDDGVHIYRYQHHKARFKIFNSLSVFFNMYRLGKVFKKISTLSEVDLIISRDYRSSLGLISVAKKNKTAIIYVIPGIVKFQDAASNSVQFSNLKTALKAFYNKSIYYGIHSFIQKKAIKKVTLNVLFSENMKMQLSSIMNCDSNFLQEKIAVIRPGVETERFIKHENTSFLKNEIGFDEDAFILLCLGRVIPAKGMDIAIRSMKYIKHPKAKLLIVGGGAGLQDLKNMVKEMEFQHKVVFAGISEEPEKYYRLADVFLMTSLYEPFGQTILEAMASGLPVVAFNSYENPELKTASSEIIQDGENGFLCSFGAQSLANKINEISRKEADSQLGEIGVKAREKVLEDYSWDSFTAKVLSLVNKSEN